MEKEWWRWRERKVTDSLNDSYFLGMEVSIVATTCDHDQDFVGIGIYYQAGINSLSFLVSLEVESWSQPWSWIVSISIDTQKFWDFTGINTHKCWDLIGINTWKCWNLTGIDNHNFWDFTGINTHKCWDLIGINTRRCCWDLIIVYASKCQDMTRMNTNAETTQVSTLANVETWLVSTLEDVVETWQ